MRIHQRNIYWNISKTSWWNREPSKPWCRRCWVLQLLSEGLSFELKPWLFDFSLEFLDSGLLLSSELSRAQFKSSVNEGLKRCTKTVLPLNCCTCLVESSAIFDTSLAVLLLLPTHFFVKWFSSLQSIHYNIKYQDSVFQCVWPGSRSQEMSFFCLIYSDKCCIPVCGMTYPE